MTRTWRPNFFLTTALATVSLLLLELTPSRLAKAEQDAIDRASVGVRSENNVSERYGTGRKVALIIGNANYTEIGPLRNPVNDAEDMASTLTALGFDEVILLKDSSLQEMKNGLHRYYSAVQNGSVGVFYFAGHGVQSNGENYLIPANASIVIEEELPDEALALTRVLSWMKESNSGINVVILDACRNNPFSRSWGGRNVSRGLTSVNAGNEVGSFYIAYATQPGGVAADGIGENGTFTSALLDQLLVPNVQIEQLFKNVRAAVMQKTNGTQNPWTSSSLLGNFTFNSGEVDAQELIDIRQVSSDIEIEPPAIAPSYENGSFCFGSVCPGLPQ